MTVFFIGVDEYLPLAQSLSEYLSDNLEIIDEGEALTYPFDNEAIIYPNYFLGEKLEKELDGLDIICPLHEISQRWNNKIFQYDRLSTKVPVPDYAVHENIFNLLKYLCRHRNRKMVITSPVGNCGSASMLFTPETELSEVYKKYKEEKCQFRTSNYIENSVGVAVNVVMTDDDEPFIAPITQQKLKGLKYIGAFYPSTISKEAQKKIINYSLKIADYMSGDFYVGLCGIDYIVSGDEVYFSEVNPRKTGTAVAVSKMLSHSLSVIEYLIIKGEELPEIKVKEFEWEI